MRPRKLWLKGAEERREGYTQETASSSVLEHEEGGRVVKVEFRTDSVFTQMYSGLCLPK